MFFYENETLSIIEIVKEQKPHIVWLSDIETRESNTISSIRPFTQLIVGQLNNHIPSALNIDAFDIVFSSAPDLVVKLRNSGNTSYYRPNFFEPYIFFSSNNDHNRMYQISFIGDINSISEKSRVHLSYVFKNHIHFWKKSSNKSKQMLTFYRSHIVINAINVSDFDKHLFEATGCGALLITEYKDYLGQLFKIG